MRFAELRESCGDRNNQLRVAAIGIALYCNWHWHRLLTGDAKRAESTGVWLSRKSEI